MRKPRPISENFIIYIYIILSIFKTVPIDLWKHSVNKIRSQTVHKNRNSLIKIWILNKLPSTAQKVSTLGHHSPILTLKFFLLQSPDSFSKHILASSKMWSKKILLPSVESTDSHPAQVYSVKWLDQGTYRKGNTLRCIGVVYYFKGLGQKVNMKGIMGRRLVKLMQATIILVFSLFLKAQ